MSKSPISPPPNHPDLILALNFMSANPPKFHWFLFLPDLGNTTGTKFHAVTHYPETGGREWVYEHLRVSVDSLNAVAAAAVIGSGIGTEELHEVLKDIPMAVPEIDKDREVDFTCRVWIREALRRMHACGFVMCEDVDGLEDEMGRYGAGAFASIEDETFKCATLVRAQRSRSVHQIQNINNSSAQSQ